MTQPRLTAFALALGGALATADTTSAAWNNVFQVCCHDKPRVSFFAPPCPDPCPPPPCPQPCPQPEVRVSYVQRCYYQPVTEYVQRKFMEPVTRNVTSYYYEPVTEYRYSTYYDPCTGCPQKVCTPCTSYRMRSRCNSVTSYVERCCMVPVTTLKPVTVQQPVVSYYYPPCPNPCPPATSSFFPPPPPLIPHAGSPGVTELRENQPSVAPHNGSDAIVPQELPTRPPGMSYPRPGTNTKLRPDRTASLTKAVSIRGEVVLPDQLTPRANAKLVFVSADNPERKEYVNANRFGEFDVRLPAGKWYLYLGGDNGRATYHKQLSLGDRETVDYRVVSR
jgi:hypothetical protein